MRGGRGRRFLRGPGGWLMGARPGRAKTCRGAIPAGICPPDHARGRPRGVGLPAADWARGGRAGACAEGAISAGICPSDNAHGRPRSVGLQAADWARRGEPGLAPGASLPGRCSARRACRRASPPPDLPAVFRAVPCRAASPALLRPGRLPGWNSCPCGLCPPHKRSAPAGPACCFPGPRHAGPPRLLCCGPAACPGGIPAPAACAPAQTLCARRAPPHTKERGQPPFGGCPRFAAKRQWTLIFCARC